MALLPAVRRYYVTMGLAYGLFVRRQAVPRYDGACPHRTLIVTRMRWPCTIPITTGFIPVG